MYLKRVGQKQLINSDRLCGPSSWSLDTAEDAVYCRSYNLLVALKVWKSFFFLAWLKTGEGGGVDQHHSLLLILHINHYQILITDIHHDTMHILVTSVNQWSS